MNPTTDHKVNTYLQLLGTLFLIMKKIRREGLTSVEPDYEFPDESDIFKIFAPYDKTNPVYTFICDVLRMTMSGNINMRDMLRYVDAYRKTTTLSDEQASLFECAKLTLIASLFGNSPIISAEHGRQGIPANEKPTFHELEAFLRKLKNESEPSIGNIEAG